MSKKVHVARNGQTLGSYEPEKFDSLLEAGDLLPTDQFFDEQKKKWLPISMLRARPATTEQPATDSAPAEARPPIAATTGFNLPPTGPSQPGAEKNARKKTPDAKVMAGWIAFLFAIGASAGFWGWSQSLAGQLKAANDKIDELTSSLDTLKKQNDLMSELTPAGRVRGIITYETTSNQIAIMSGATVGLYKRSDVEQALAKANLAPGGVKSSDDFDHAIEQLKGVITSPVEITLTDSKGRLDVGVPGAGDYVLVASAAKTNASGTTDRFLWLIGFHDQQQPSNLILLNEKNAISLKNPQFNIKTLKSLAVDPNAG